MNRKFYGKQTFIAALLAVNLMLSACIPQGGGDYRINQNGAARPSAEAPLQVPENRVINATPSWSPAIVERNSRQVESSRYLVEQGDTLTRVVSKTGASLADIAALNNLSPPYVLKVGQELDIPSGLYHNVNAGETGIAIARAYGAPWSEIVALNGLTAPYILNVGQRLKLPASASAGATAGASAGATASAPVNAPSLPSPEQRAATFSLDIDDVVTGGEPAANIGIAPVQAQAQAPANNFASAIAKPANFSGSFLWPLSGQTISRFGSKGGGKVNDGINIAAADGTAVIASGAGVVVYSGNEIGVFGGLILVDHGGGWITAYGHLGQLAVARGDQIRAGQRIGNVGTTGYVDRPQLHFEIRRDRKPVDPLGLLPSR